MKLNLYHLNEKLPSLTSSKLKEFLFMTNGGFEHNDKEKIQEIIFQQISKGKTIHIVSIRSFLQNVLILISEEGRFEFLTRIGEQLNTFDSDISSRELWAKLLSEIIN